MSVSGRNPRAPMRLHDVTELLGVPDSFPLFDEARRVRDAVFGSDVFLRGVVEFDNHCRKNCRYCGLREGNRDLERFSMDSGAIVDAARYAAESGMGTVVLQSGEEGGGVRRIGRVIEEIKKLGNISVTLCLGERHEDAYRHWRDCGADRYLLKMETFDAELYSRCRPGQRIGTRLQKLETLRRLGYETGSGIITGLPGMTREILAGDLMKLSSLSLDMVAVGPFVPHPDTPLGASPAGSLEDALRAVALLRIMNPLANIPATSALDALAPDGREQGLCAGANVIMPSVTPESFRAGYVLYPDRSSSSMSVAESIRRLRRRLHWAGCHPSSDRGISPAYTH